MYHSKNNINITVILKMLLVITYIFLILSILIAYDNPAKKYEVSIYGSTPIIVFVLPIITVILSTIILLYSSYVYYNKILYISSIINVLITYVFFLSLFIIRGYFAWTLNGDPSTHMGIIRQILTTGYFPSSNLFIYPITHIYVAEFSQITFLNIFDLSKLIPLIFGILYILFIYILSKLVLNNRQSLFVLLLSCSFNLGYYLNLTPNHLSNLFLPFVIFVIVKYFKTNRLSFGILSLIVFDYTLFHLLPTIVILLVMISYVVSHNVRIYMKYKNFNSLILPVILLILAIWIIVWVSYFDIFNTSIVDAIQVVTGISASDYTEYSAKVSTAESYGYNIYDYVIKTQGTNILYIVLAIASVPILFRYMKQHLYSTDIIFLYSSLIVLCLCFLLLFLLNAAIGPFRLMIYVIMLSTIIISYIFDILITMYKVNTKNILLSIVVIIVFIFISMSYIANLLLLYPSPYTLSPNYQTTKMEFDGMNWMIYHKNIQMHILSINIAPYRFADITLNRDDQIKINLFLGYPSMYPDNFKIKYHFGYDNSTIIGNYYQNQYLVITASDKTIYTDIFPDMAKYRFFNEDFEKLNYDISISKIYYNGDFEAFYIK